MELRRGILRREPDIFEIGRKGHVGYSLPGGEGAEPSLPEHLKRSEPPRLPTVTEVEAVRHYTRLSHWNHSVELGMYPLGSCTMKYNPKLHDTLTRMPAFSRMHPMMDDASITEQLELLKNLEDALCAISGFDAVTLQPPAGAAGEFTGLAVIKAALKKRGEADQRIRVLVPDTAHGTNPASVVLNGFKPVSVQTGPEGYLTVDMVREHLDDTIAALMVTNPNTLGIYERELKEIAEEVHKAGGYVYMDGANFNALMGKVRPADIGVDVMHFNLHKTFSTPHGGGGPGAGPVGVTSELEPYLPVPRIVQDGDDYRLDWNREDSIGKVHAFLGNFDVFVRAYAYILEYGHHLETVTERAVLNARYLRARLEDVLEIPYDTDTLHEAVFTDKTLKKETGVTTMDIAKRLLDHGVHPPTVYFPLIVPGAFMVEPTETESKADLDYFVDAVKSIIQEAHENPELVKSAPHTTGIRRLDETRAARKPVLRWTPAPDSNSQ